MSQSHLQPDSHGWIVHPVLCWYSDLLSFLKISTDIHWEVIPLDHTVLAGLWRGETQRAWMMVRENMANTPWSTHIVFSQPTGFLIKTLPGLWWKDMVITDSTHANSKKGQLSSALMQCVWCGGYLHTHPERLSHSINWSLEGWQRWLKRTMKNISSYGSIKCF